MVCHLNTAVMMRLYIISSVMITGFSLHGQSNLYQSGLQEPYSVSGVSKSVVSIASYPHNPNDKTLIGTGVIYHRNGFIVTMQSVVREDDEIIVTFADGSVRPGKLLRYSSPNGLVLIKVEGSNYPAVIKGKSTVLNRMSILTVIGNSLGVFPSVTLASFLGFEPNGYLDVGAIIPAGNCGSPVFDSEGNLVCLILGRVYEQGAGQVAQAKIGVALPIELIRHEIDEEVKFFNNNRGWIGITAAPVENSDYVRIIDIVENGPSDLAGLAIGDTVVMYEGWKVKGLNDLMERVIRNVPGTKIALTLKKGNRRISHLITVSEEVRHTSNYKYCP